MSPKSKVQSPKSKTFFKFAFLFLFTAYCLLLTAYSQTAVKGETVWTMAGEPIQNGVVLIGANGKIEKVGTAASVSIPANYKVLTAKVVTPGLIDAHTVVGLNGYLNQPHDQMALDTSATMQPELRAVDAYNTEEVLIGWLRSFGITTIHTGHGIGAVISGQTMIAKTTGKTVEDAVIIPTAMVAANIGESAIGGARNPGTRAKLIAVLRNEFLKAQEYQRKVDDAKGDATKMPPRDLRQETLGRILKREIPLLVTTHRHQDIISTIRFAKEFNIRVVLDGVAEAYMVLPEIKLSGFPVIVHPTMQRAGGEAEHLSMETASKLKQAGIPIALQSGYEGYVPKTRVVLLEAAVAASNGLSFRDALATITIDAAKILGIEAKVGSLEIGKDGDVAMFDGDPFEYTSHCIGTIINGKVVSEIVR